MSSQRERSILRDVSFLTLVLAAGWIASLWPARVLGGGSGVLWMSVAAAACLGPGWVVVFLANAASLSSDLAVMLVQTMVRLMFVSAVAVVIKKTHPELGFVGFFGWLVGFYLLALVTEVWLLFRQRGRKQPAVSVPESHVNDD